MRTRRGVLLGLSILALPGCTVGIDSRPSVTATTMATTPTPSPTASTDGSDTIDRDAALNTAYALNFRQRYPQLAAGRTDADLAGAGVRVCVYLTDDESPTTVFVQRVQMAFKNGDLTPAGTDIHGIAEVSTLNICPELQSKLDRVLGPNTTST